MSLNQLIIFLAFIFGACLGSFLNVVIWRLPRGEKITGRSRCPSCGKILQAQDLVPILSFLLLRRRCRNCKTKISYRYPLLEFAVAALFAFSTYFYIGNSLSWLLLFKALVVVCILVPVFVIDLEHYLILDSIIFFGSVIIILLNFLLDFFSKTHFWTLSSAGFGGVLAGIFGALPFFLIWFFSKGRWMGFGDVKLAVFLGLVLGWPLIWLNIFLAVILGGFFGIFLLLFFGKGLKTKLPFGTFLSVACLICLFYGHLILNWYLGFLGL